MLSIKFNDGMVNQIVGNREQLSLGKKVLCTENRASICTGPACRS